MRFVCSAVVFSWCCAGILLAQEPDLDLNAGELQAALRQLELEPANPVSELPATDTFPSKVTVPTVAQVEREARERKLAFIRGLIVQLDDDSFFAREEATKQLMAVGDDALRPLCAELQKGPPPEVRYRATRIVRRIIQELKDAGYHLRDPAAKVPKKSNDLLLIPTFKCLLR